VEERHNLNFAMYEKGEQPPAQRRRFTFVQSQRYVQRHQVKVEVVGNEPHKLADFSISSCFIHISMPGADNSGLARSTSVKLSSLGSQND
jgi:hypothetical protein